MKSLLKKIKGKFSESPAPVMQKSFSNEELTDPYIRKGRIPWSQGYAEYKWKVITGAISDPSVLSGFAGNGKIPEAFGLGVDNRSVEYPWLFSRLKKIKQDFLMQAPLLIFRK